MKPSYFISLMFLFIFYGCAEISSSRSFVTEMERDSDGFFAPGVDFPVVAGDTGEQYRSREEIFKRTPQSEGTQRYLGHQDLLKRQLVQREDLLTEEERMRYNEDSNYLHSDSEKLYYLSLAPSDRAEYLATKAPASSSRIRSVTRAPASTPLEVFLGMNKDEVRSLWGEPNRVDVAGDPLNQNERWVFFQNGSPKQIYFESGVVGGWRLE